MRVYEGLRWDVELPDRPFVALNMVATLDGKTVSGEAQSPIRLGSPSDKQAMRDIESAADAVVIGRKTLEATPGLWYEARLRRYVVTSDPTGLGHGRFFTDAPDQAFIVTGQRGSTLGHEGPNFLVAGTHQVDIGLALRKMRLEHQVRHLVLEGGSRLNGSFFSEDLVDEIFLTVAPLIKLGIDLPTIASGPPLAEEVLLKYELVSHTAVGNELFLRYRRRPA